MRVHVGTSGYNYPEWRGTFYPEDLPAKRMFAFYAERFSAVEINYTFYRMPTPKTTEAWRAQAPEGFRYVLKAPKRITHERRLVDCADTLAFFCDSASGLAEHRGPLLFQLPPNLKCDPARLEAFLALMPADAQAAFEFRHESWHTDEVLGLLRAKGAALCIADFGDRSTPVVATARRLAAVWGRAAELEEGGDGKRFRVALVVPSGAPETVPPPPPPFEPPVVAATPIVPPAQESSPPSPVAANNPAQTAAPASVPEVRKKGSALFFSPSRKPPTSAIPAIPIGVPGAAPSIGTAPQPVLRTAGPQ